MIDPIQIAAVALVVIVFGAVSRKLDRWPLTMPMVFASLGLVVAATGLLRVSADNESILLLAEITLAVILFSDAVRIDVPRLRRHVIIPVRLLGIGLPLTIAFGALVNSLLFPDLPFAQVALLAAVLAPTDAALGSAVVEAEEVPVRERLALNVESGVNDGLVVPVVAILTALVIDENRSSVSWAGFVAQQIGWGVGLGVVIGAGAIVMLRRAHQHGWSDARFEQIATFAVPILAVFSAQALSGNAFIAAFVAGLTFGSFRVPGSTPDDSSSLALTDELDVFTEDAAQLLAIGAFFLFGNVLLPEALDALTIPVLVCALMTLSIGRMLPVWLSLTGSSLPTVTKLFVGWFGPRGLASILFGLILLEETEAATDVGEQLFAVIAVTVAASIVLHGATAAPGAEAYARWIHRNDAMPPADDDEMEMPRTRWSDRSDLR